MQGREDPSWVGLEWQVRAGDRGDVVEGEGGCQQLLPHAIATVPALPATGGHRTQQSEERRVGLLQVREEGVVVNLVGLASDHGPGKE